MGTSVLTNAQMINFLEDYYSSTGKSFPEVYSDLGAATPADFINVLDAAARSEGVRSDVVFSQMILETGYLQFGGDVSAEQCNFAGIGATGNGEPGFSFRDVHTGLLAQAQHLKAYACNLPLNNQQVDPRFGFVLRGCAPTVEQLGGHWAPSHLYGIQIVDLMKRIGSHEES